MLYSMDYCEYPLLLRETGFNLFIDTGCFYLQIKGFLDKAVHGHYIHVIEGLSICPAAKVKCTNVLFISHTRLKEVAFILYMKKK